MILTIASLENCFTGQVSNNSQTVVKGIVKAKPVQLSTEPNSRKGGLNVMSSKNLQ